MHKAMEGMLERTGDHTGSKHRSTGKSKGKGQHRKIRGLISISQLLEGFSIDLNIIRRVEGATEGIWQSLSLAKGPRWLGITSLNFRVVLAMIQVSMFANGIPYRLLHLHIFSLNTTR